MADNSIAGISIRITGDFGDLLAKIKEATAAAEAGGKQIAEAFNAGTGGLEALAAAADKATPALTSTAGALAEVAGGAGQAGIGFKDIIGAAVGFVGVEMSIKAITSAMRDLAEAAIGTFAQIERSTIALTALSGNAQHASETIALLKTQAMDQALSFPALLEANQRVLALGFSSTQAAQSLRAAADAAAATGLQFSQISPAMDRIAQSGALVGRQLATIGLTLQDVAKAAGTTTDAIRETFKNMDPGDRLDLLIKSLQKFQGTAEAVSKSLSGQFQNLQTEMTLAFSGIGEALAPLLKQLMSLGQENVVPAIEALVAAFKDLASAVGPLVGGVLSEVVTGLSDMATVAAASVSGLVAIGKAAAGIVTDVTNVDLTWHGLLETLNTVNPFHIAATEIQLMRGQIDFWNQSALLMKQRFAEVTDGLKKFIDTTTSNSGMLGLRNEWDAQTKAIADARAQVDLATQAYAKHLIGVGELHQKQEALNQAILASDPALRTAAAAAKSAAAFNEQFALSLQKAVDASKNYEAGTATLSSTQSALNAIMEQASLKWDKLSETSKGLVQSLIPLTNQLNELGKEAGIQKLTDDITKLGLEYPKQFAEMDSATLDLINSIRTMDGTLANLEGMKAFLASVKEWLASEKQLEDSQKQLTTTMEGGEKSVKAFGSTFLLTFGQAESATANLAAHIKDMLRDQHNAGMQFVDDIAKINSGGLLTVQQMQNQLDEWNKIVAAAERLHVPMSEQLTAIHNQLTATLAYNEAVGASSAENLKLAQAITQVSLAQFALHQQTMGDAILWNTVTTDMVKAFDTLGQTMATAWMNGDLGAKALMDTMKKLATQILGDLVQGALKDLAASLIQNSGLMQTLGATAVSTVKTSTDAITSATSAASHSITQIASAAVSSISSLVGMVTGIISAITGIIGNIEMAHMEKTLGQIETNTRQAFNALGAGSQSIAGTSLLSSQKLTDILQNIQGPVISLLVSISGNLDDINSKMGTMVMGSGGDSSGLLQTISDLKGQLQVLNEQFNQAHLASLSAPASTTVTNSAPSPTGSAAVDYSGLAASGTPQSTPAYVPTVMEALLANIDSNTADILEALADEFKTTTQMIHARAVADAMSGFLSTPLDLLAKVANGFPDLMATLNGTATSLGGAAGTLATAASNAAVASQTLATASSGVALVLGSASTQIATVAEILAIKSNTGPVLGSQLLASQLPTGSADVPGFKTQGGSALGSQINVTVNVPGTLVGSGGMQQLSDTVANTMISTLSAKGIRLTRG
jgi:hypothetical protein